MSEGSNSRPIQRVGCSECASYLPFAAHSTAAGATFKEARQDALGRSHHMARFILANRAIRFYCLDAVPKVIGYNPDGFIQVGCLPIRRIVRPRHAPASVRVFDHPDPISSPDTLIEAIRP